MKSFLKNKPWKTKNFISWWNLFLFKKVIGKTIYIYIYQLYHYILVFIIPDPISNCRTKYSYTSCSFIHYTKSLSSINDQLQISASWKIVGTNVVLYKILSTPKPPLHEWGKLIPSKYKKDGAGFGSACMLSHLYLIHLFQEYFLT